MTHQSERRIRKHKSCCHAHRSIDSTRQPRTCFLLKINAPEEVQKRRRALIAKAAYSKWRQRLSSGAPGNDLQDWLSAEIEIDANELAAKEAWKQTIYRVIIAAMIQTTGISAEEICHKTPVPMIDDDRQLMYSLIITFLQGRPLNPDNPEDGYADTVGELVEEMFFRVHWIEYLAG